MAKIESYQQATQPLSFSDMLIGTDVLGPIPNATKNFSLTELYNLFATIPNVGNLQDTLNVGNSATQDIYLSGIITCNSITPTFIEDYTLSTGIAGQFLQSSASGILWATPSVPNLQSVLNSGNTATQNILLTGNISLTKVIPLQIQDSTSSTGSVGQSLFVSMGGLLWANPATVTSIATSGLISGGPITTTGTISTSMATNRLVGRGTSGTGVMEEIILGTNLSLTGTTLNATSGGVTSVTGTFPVSSSGGATPAISMLQSSSITDGYLSSIDWTTFNSKQTAITLTTLGTSGASTLIGATLNIPQYTDTYLGTVTSVALTMPSAFSVTGSPITSSGTLAITGAGLASQYIDGTGALQAFPSVGSGTVTSVATAGLISGGAITTTGTITTLMNTNKLVGRSTIGTGIMEEITVGTGLSLSAGTLTASGASPLTTKGDLYTYDTTNARLPIGLDTQILLADSSTTTGLKWGTNTAATPLGYYGAFSDVTDQFATVINTGYPMLLGVTDLTNGVTVVSSSRITIANTGIYNIQWSAQFRNPTASEHDVTIWLRKNGVDVPGSAGVVSVPKKHGSFDGHNLPSWNFLLDAIAGDYYEFVWSTQDLSVFISFEPAGSPPPSTASVVLTVTQQSGIMSGTGITAINSLTGASQTMVAGISGTDFAVNSLGTTHTLNLPSSSALNRGALTAADWTTFNNKGNGTVTSVAASVPTFLSIAGSPITTSGTLAISLSGTALPVLNGGTGVTTSTGSGDTVLSTSPTLVTPILGSASATALTFSSTAVSGLTINKLTTAQRQALTPVMGDVVYDTTIGTTCTYTGTFWQYSKEYYATSNVTTTSTLASTITGLTTFVLEANSSYNLNGQFLIGCNNTGGVKFGNTLPAGAVSLYYINGISTAGTLFLQAASSNGALTASGLNRVNGTSTMIFGGVINIGATAGAISMQFASATAAQTSTVYGLFSSGYQSKITLTKIA